MAAPQGPHVRVATATTEELKAAETKDGVWYDFEPGDIVPVQFGFIGVMEGGTETPVVFRAKRRFSFITHKNQPMQISFDRQGVAGPSSHQTVIAVLPRPDGKGGQLGWLLYIGESGDVESELKATVKGTK